MQLMDAACGMRDTPWRIATCDAPGVATSRSTMHPGVHQLHWMRYVVGEVAGVSGLVRTFEPLRYRRDAEGRKHRAG